MLYSKGNNYCSFYSHKQHINVLWGTYWFLEEVIRTEANVIYSPDGTASTSNRSTVRHTVKLSVHYRLHTMLALA
jgi:hypothetical protein